jgi:phage-related minor tail protein
MGAIISSTNRDYINQNWDKLKCSPIAPFLQMVGVAPGDTNETSNACKSAEFNAMFNSGMLDHIKNTNLLTESFGKISNELNSFRAVIANIQQQAFKDLSVVASKLFEIYVKIGNIFMVLIKHIRNILQILKHTVNTGANLMRMVIALINLIRVPVNFILRIT